MKLRDINPFADPPNVKTLIQEELEELKRELYLEDKRADHHIAQAEALRKRLKKLADYLGVQLA